jgi:hypothetical protein
MNSNEIESNVKRIFEKFSKEEFPFDLLLAYGIPHWRRSPDLLPTRYLILLFYQLSESRINRIKGLH